MNAKITLSHSDFHRYKITGFSEAQDFFKWKSRADGSECVVGLEFAGEFVADFPFSLYGKKSRVSIVAVTPSEIYCISAREVGMRMKSDEELYRAVAEANVALFDTIYDRYIDLHVKSVQERYNELIDKYKDIFLYFSLKDIASFLNITPTHLSRLRKS